MEVEVLSRLLDQELEKEEEALALPPLVPTLSIRLIPLRKAPPTRDALPLNGSAPSRLVTPHCPRTNQNQPEPPGRSPDLGCALQHPLLGLAGTVQSLHYFVVTA